MTCYMKASVPNVGSLLFNRIQIMKTTIRPNMNSCIELRSGVIVNVNIVILDNSFMFNVINVLVWVLNTCVLAVIKN